MKYFEANSFGPLQTQQTLLSLLKPSRCDAGRSSAAPGRLCILSMMNMIQSLHPSLKIDNTETDPESFRSCRSLAFFLSTLILFPPPINL